MLRIYGWKKSRAIRCMWVMEELGLPYQQVPLNPHTGETRTAEYLAINPSGKIPALVDGDFVLTESIAINAYLASTHRGTLWPGTAQDVARVLQWTSWAVTELEPPLIAMFREGRRPAAEIDQSRIEAWRADALARLKVVLEPQLARSAYLLPGADFTLADLNVASVVSSMRVFGFDLAAFPNTVRWLDKCLARPAWLRLQDPA
jgi:glutathione S-transferase